MMFLTISIPFFKFIGNNTMESLLTTSAFSVILCCFLVGLDDGRDSWMTFLTSSGATR